MIARNDFSGSNSGKSHHAEQHNAAPLNRKRIRRIGLKFYYVFEYAGEDASKSSVGEFESSKQITLSYPT